MSSSSFSPKLTSFCPNLSYLKRIYLKTPNNSKNINFLRQIHEKLTKPKYKKCQFRCKILTQQVLQERNTGNKSFACEITSLTFKTNKAYITSNAQVRLQKSCENFNKFGPCKFAVGLGHNYGTSFVPPTLGSIEIIDTD